MNADSKLIIKEDCILIMNQISVAVAQNEIIMNR